MTVYILIIGWIITLLVLVPALLKKRKIDNEKLERYAETENNMLNKIAYLNDEIANKEIAKNTLDKEMAVLSNEMNMQHEHLITLREEEGLARKTLASLAETEQKIKANMEKSIEERSEMLAKEYREAELAHAEEYKVVMLDAVQDFTAEWNKNIEDLNGIKKQIEDKRKIFETILADEQRKAKDEAERDFYRLNISDEDLTEVEKIRDITPYFRNPEVLGKAVWSAYFQKPYQDLIARQFNSSKPSGIYKITCLHNSKIYIGQSVNVPNRFSEHIKRGLGAEPVTRNRLYSEMKKWGVENFIFELLEEVPRDKLDERERFWIEYFHSADAEVRMNGNKGVKG